MRLTLMGAFVLSCAFPAFAQDQEPKVTQLIPMSESLDELIDEGYDLITIDYSGIAWLEDGTNKLVMCAMSGDPAIEIRSVCKQVGK
ncbi:MAG: hypothetical protein ABJG96_09895 [Paracoccaceae bacterium]